MTTRDEIERIADAVGSAALSKDDVRKRLVALCEQARAEERERCAAVCDEAGRGLVHEIAAVSAERLASRIRALGSAPRAEAPQPARASVEVPYAPADVSQEREAWIREQCGPDARARSVEEHDWIGRARDLLAMLDAARAEVERWKRAAQEQAAAHIAHAGPGLRREADARLIAAMHDALPELLADVDRLTRELGIAWAQFDWMSRDRDAERARADAAETALGNLLAVIHRDGGHRLAEVGAEQAVREAHERWAEVVRRADAAEAENVRLREVGASALHLSMVRVTDPELVDLSRAVDRAQKAERERAAAEAARDAWLAELADVAQALGLPRATSPDFGEVDISHIHAAIREMAVKAEAARASLAAELAALREAGREIASIGVVPYTDRGNAAMRAWDAAYARSGPAVAEHDARVRREALREAEERLRDEVTADAARNVDAIDEDDPVMANFYRVRAEHTARAADKIAALASREHGQ